MTTKNNTVEYTSKLNTEGLIDILTRELTSIFPKPKSFVKRALHNFKRQVIIETAFDVLEQAEKSLLMIEHKPKCKGIVSPLGSCDCGALVHNNFIREVREDFNKIKKIYEK